MPTYDYECAACGHTFEHFQSMNDAPLKKCPACGKLKLQRLIGSGAGIIFKGSGFYETDYKRKGAPAATKETPASTTPAASSGDASPAPAAKPAAKESKPAAGKA